MQHLAQTAAFPAQLHTHTTHSNLELRTVRVYEWSELHPVNYLYLLLLLLLYYAFDSAEYAAHRIHMKRVIIIIVMQCSTRTDAMSATERFSNRKIFCVTFCLIMCSECSVATVNVCCTQSQQTMTTSWVFCARISFSLLVTPFKYQLSSNFYFFFSYFSSLRAAQNFILVNSVHNNNFQCETIKKMHAHETQTTLHRCSCQLVSKHFNYESGIPLESV